MEVVSYLITEVDVGDVCVRSGFIFYVFNEEGGKKGSGGVVVCWGYLGL